MRRVKLLIDEDTHLVLAPALRARGYDAVHVREADRRGQDDLVQLRFAVAEGRCFLTFNVGHFVQWHTTFIESGWEHSGIIVSPHKPVGRLLRDTLAFLQTHSADDVLNQIFFL